MVSAPQIRNIVVYQPQFLPWIGFWNKYISADRFVLYAGVKFDQGGYMHRVQIDGKWVGFPVEAHSRSKMIKDVRLVEQTAGYNMVASLKSRRDLSKAQFSDRLEPVFQAAEKIKGHDFLVDVTQRLLVSIVDALELDNKFRLDTEERPGLTATEKLDDLLKQQETPGYEICYLQGSAGKAYMGYDSLKVPKETMFQEVNTTADTNSILHLIANHPWPLEEIENCAVWRAKDGRCYDWSMVEVHP